MQNSNVQVMPVVNMSEGVKIRAQIDLESVKSVLLVNGGGSVALLALLPAVIQNIVFVKLVLATLAAWLMGLSLGVLHNVLRRRCSQIFENHGMHPPKGVLTIRVPFSGRKILARTLPEPTICWVGWWCLYLSLAAFVIGGAVMVVGGFFNLDALTSSRP